MVFLLFWIFFTFFGLGLFSLAYYGKLLYFRPKEEYQRQELTSILRPIVSSVTKLWESGGNLLFGIGVFFLSGLFSFLWASLGSILGSPGPGIWEHIFHTPIFFFGLLFGFPFLQEAYPNEIKIGLVKPTLVGLALGNLSSAAVHYGMDRDIYFLFLLLVLGIQVLPLVFLINGEPLLGVSFEPEAKDTFYDDSVEEQFSGEPESWDDDDPFRS